jgi:hypothetical protein
MADKSRFSDFIKDNAIKVTNKHALRWEVELPRIQDYILSTTYGMLPLLTFKFPEAEKEVTAEDVQKFYQHQKMAMIAARGFNVAYELIGNLRNADWYNQVRKSTNFGFFWISVHINHGTFLMGYSSISAFRLNTSN